jgi:MFS family permease
VRFGGGTLRLRAGLAVYPLGVIHPDAVANAMTRTGDGRRLLAAQVCDHFALGIGIVAFPWLVLDGGGGPTLAGLVFTVAALPYVVFGLPAGVVGDRHSRKKMMVGSHLGQALCAGVLPLWALGADPPIALALACAFAVGVGRTFADAAAFGAVADVVGPANFAQGQAALSTAWATGSIAGPFAGGVLVASIGAAPAVAVESVGFVVAALLVSRIRRPLAAPAQEAYGRARDAVREGIALIWETPVLRLLTGVQLLWYLTVIGAQALIVPFLRDEVALDADEVGWILGVGAAMGIAAGLLVGAALRHMEGLWLVAGGIFVSALAPIGLAGADGFWSALVAFSALTLAIWVSVTTLIGERQRHAPHHLQARVGITGRGLAFSSMMIGSLAASSLASFVPLRALYLGVGLAALAVAVWAVPSLLRTAAAEAAPE